MVVILVDYFIEKSMFCVYSSMRLPVAIFDDHIVAGNHSIVDTCSMGSTVQARRKKVFG